MIRLDDQDLKILLTLQREGRITKVKLAEAVNLSPSLCWERLKRLEDLGVISGYHAHINLEMLVKPTLVMTEVTLRHHQHEDFAIFERRFRISGNRQMLRPWRRGGLHAQGAVS